MLKTSKFWSPVFLSSTTQKVIITLFIKLLFFFLILKLSELQSYCLYIFFEHYPDQIMLDSDCQDRMVFYKLKESEIPGCFLISFE